jgi:hypothetical protein
VIDDEPLDGYDRVSVTDPFGNRIELMQPGCRPVAAASAPHGSVVRAVVLVESPAVARQ